MENKNSEKIAGAFGKIIGYLFNWRIWFVIGIVLFVLDYIGKVDLAWYWLVMPFCMPLFGVVVGFVLIILISIPFLIYMLIVSIRD